MDEEREGDGVNTLSPSKNRRRFLKSAAVAALCGVYIAGVRIAEAVQGRVIVPDGPEAEH